MSKKYEKKTRALKKNDVISCTPPLQIVSLDKSGTLSSNIFNSAPESSKEKC